MQLSGHACYWILHSALLSHEQKCKHLFSLCDSLCGLNDASSSIICTSCHYSSTKPENAVSRGEVILQISKLLREAVLQLLTPQHGSWLSPQLIHTATGALVPHPELLFWTSGKAENHRGQSL